MYIPVAKTNHSKRESARKRGWLLFLSDKPEMVAGESNRTVGSWDKNGLTLQCVARGVPTTSFRWFKPGGGEIFANVNPFKGGSRMTVTTRDPGDYGQYKCRANNSLGLTDHIITVNQWREYQVQNQANLRIMKTVPASRHKLNQLET